MPPIFDGEILGRLADLTPDEIVAALASIRAEGESLAGQPPTAEIVARSAELAGFATSLRGEQAARAESAATFNANLMSLTELTEPDAVEPEPAPPAPPVQPDEPADDDTPVTEPETPVTEPAAQPAVTAAARRRLGSNNTGTVPGTGLARTLPKIAFRTTASTGLKDHDAGTPLTREQLFTAFHDKVRAVSSLRHTGSRAERYNVTTIRAEYPEARTLTAAGGDYAAMDKINAVVREAQRLHASDNAQALTAAGLCAPLDNDYDIEVIGDDDRPVRDALARFQVDRGGVQWRPSIDGVSQTGGIGTWTEANDQASPLVPKTCVEIACPTLSEAQVEAIYQCLTFSNMSTRFDPEFMAAVIRAQRIAHARYAENKLLTALTTGSKVVYSTQILGAARDALWTLDHMIAYYRSVHRLRNDVPLRMIAPLWMLNMLRADITYQMVGDGLQSLAVTDAEIASWFTARNVNITWHLDGIDPADITAPTPDIVVPAQYFTSLTTESAVPGFPDAVSTLLFREGDWLFLDGGTLDLGTVRDSTLNGLNRFQTFAESFEGTAFRGIESFELVLRLNPTGASAATVSTSAAS
jgi:hypothetical protein